VHRSLAFLEVDMYATTQLGVSADARNFWALP
jgi:hypothetical protein